MSNTLKIILVVLGMLALDGGLAYILFLRPRRKTSTALHRRPAGVPNTNTGEIRVIRSHVRTRRLTRVAR